MTLAQANALIREVLQKTWRLHEKYPVDSWELTSINLKQLTVEDTGDDESAALMHGECAERREE